MEFGKRYEINRTSTGWTVTVDGKLRGSRLRSKEEAEHVGRLHTDEHYYYTYQSMIDKPWKVVKELEVARRRKRPSHYLREGVLVSRYTRGYEKRKGDTSGFKLGWEQSQNVWGEVWREELLRYLKELQRYFREAEDEDAQQLVYNMAQAIRHKDKGTYDEHLLNLIRIYGEVY